MNANGFPALLQFTRLNSAITSLKEQAEQMRTEMVTGRIADPTGTLGAEVGEVQLLDKALTDIETYKLATKTALGRTSIMQLSFEQAVGNTGELSVRLFNAVSVENEFEIGLVREDSRAQLDDAIAAFNRSFNGRALFAGDAVDQPPLADAGTLLADVSAIYLAAADAAQFEADMDTYFNDPAGGFMTNIYQGGAGDTPRVAVSQDELISYGAKADEQPVRELLRSLSSIVVAAGQFPSPDRDAILNVAATRMIEAGDDITTMRSRTGVSEGRMQRALDSLDAESTALTLAFNDRVARDPFDAAARLQTLETQLQTAFVLSARISQLTLVNFLR